MSVKTASIGLRFVRGSLWSLPTSFFGLVQDNVSDERYQEGIFSQRNPEGSSLLILAD